jgi:predicted DNA-binding transcriptional regulator AlpA
MPPLIYKHDIRPNITFLQECGKLLLDTKDLAQFLQLPLPIVQRLVSSNRIPLPLHLGLGKLARWSVFELLEWTEAGCPIRSRWIELRGTSGWFPEYRWGKWWQEP